MDATVLESTPLPPSPEDRLRTAAPDARQEASKALQQRGALATMLTTFLFGLLVIFALVAVLQLCNALLSQISTVPRLAALWRLWEIFYWILTAAGVFLAILPILLGRLRISGLLLSQKSPDVCQIFYWFSSPRRYGRALCIGLILALQIVLPATACGLMVKGSLAFFNALMAAAQGGIAVSVLSIGLFLTVCVAVLLLFWSGRWLLFTALAVGNEGVSLRNAMRLAFEGGRQMGVIFRFSLVSLKDLILSFLTVGILFLFRYAHLYSLTYLRLAQALCPKGEN